MYSDTSTVFVSYFMLVEKQIDERRPKYEDQDPEWTVKFPELRNTFVLVLDAAKQIQINIFQLRQKLF